MSYSHQVPYYFGQSWTGGFSNASVSRDAGTDATTSSGDLVDDAGGMILTPSGSTVSPANITEVQSTGSLTPTASPSDSRAPSVTNKTAPVPSADIENILKNEFNNLTIREKSRALASVRKSQYPDSGPGTEADIDTETAKSGDSSEEGGLQGDSKPVLADWQALCKAVGVTYDKVPDSITKCKEVRPPHLMCTQSSHSSCPSTSFYFPPPPRLNHPL
jgi:hypothetical protein